LDLAQICDPKSSGDAMDIDTDKILLEADLDIKNFDLVSHIIEEDGLKRKTRMQLSGKQVNAHVPPPPKRAAPSRGGKSLEKMNEIFCGDKRRSCTLKNEKPQSTSMPVDSNLEGNDDDDDDDIEKIAAEVFGPDPKLNGREVKGMFYIVVLTFLNLIIPITLYLLFQMMTPRLTLHGVRQNWCHLIMLRIQRTSGQAFNHKCKRSSVKYTRPRPMALQKRPKYANQFLRNHRIHPHKVLKSRQITVQRPNHRA
jgi:hypothetical protein